MQCGNCFNWALVSFRCVHCRSDCVVFWCGLKLLTMGIGSGASWEGLQGRLGSVTTFSLTGTCRQDKVICG